MGLRWSAIWTLLGFIFLAACQNSAAEETQLESLDIVRLRAPVATLAPLNPSPKGDYTKKEEPVEAETKPFTPIGYGQNGQPSGTTGSPTAEEPANPRLRKQEADFFYEAGNYAEAVAGYDDFLIQAETIAEEALILEAYDRRGIARAMNGDLSGAAADLTVVADLLAKINP